MLGGFDQLVSVREPVTQVVAQHARQVVVRLGFFAVLQGLVALLLVPLNDVLVGLLLQAGDRPLHRVVDGGRFLRIEGDADYIGQLLV